MHFLAYCKLTSSVKHEVALVKKPLCASVCLGNPKYLSAFKERMIHIVSTEHITGVCFHKLRPELWFTEVAGSWNPRKRDWEGGRQSLFVLGREESGSPELTSSLVCPWAQIGSLELQWRGV